MWDLYQLTILFLLDQVLSHMHVFDVASLPLAITFTLYRTRDQSNLGLHQMDVEGN